jgi:hypothetical protein
MLKTDKIKEGKVSSYLGETPYVNPPFNSYSGVNSCNGDDKCSACSVNGYSLPTYQQKAGVTVDTSYAEPTTTTTNTTQETPKVSFMDKLFPILYSVTGAQAPSSPTPSGSSDAYSYKINEPREDSSMKLLLIVGGIVIALIALYFIVKALKKK